MELTNTNKTIGIFFTFIGSLTITWSMVRARHGS